MILYQLSLPIKEPEQDFNLPTTMCSPNVTEILPLNNMQQWEVYNVMINFYVFLWNSIRKRVGKGGTKNTPMLKMWKVCQECLEMVTWWVKVFWPPENSKECQGFTSWFIFGAKGNMHPVYKIIFMQKMKEFKSELIFSAHLLWTT